ncbi:MAG: hypothetical protein PF488_02055 [Patescibacteria group bacterium]|jgi:hypothetical protein|nr:hypothetical protein [Patescibacteria group bacterium]
MKKILLVSLLIILSGQIFAQISIYSNFTGESLRPTVIIANQKSLSDYGSFGLNYYTLVNQNWAEVQVGFYKNSFDWLSWGFSLGLEQNEKPLRAGSMLCLFNTKNTFLALMEKGYGRNNYWYDITAWHRFNSDIRIGFRAWRFTGVGPIMEFSIPNSNLSLWFIPAYDFEAQDQNIVFGLNYYL